MPDLPVTLGAGVTELKTGDAVWGQANIFNDGSGSFAEFDLAKAETIGIKPKNLNHTEAAALPLTGVSAVQALMENFNLSSGQKILIHGGAPGAVYGLGFIGALIYFIQNATSFWIGVLGVLKALVWPAILVYKLL